MMGFFKLFQGINLRLLRSALSYTLSILLLGSSMVSCGVLPWYDGELISYSELFGVRVNYVFPHDDLESLRRRDGLNYVGMTLYEPLGKACTVLLRRSYFADIDPIKMRGVIAHEVGHCLDRYVLNYSHNGFMDEGCSFGPYWCQPKEGFANFYAQYVIRMCNSVAIFGWPLDTEEASCDILPHPAQVTPELFQQ